MIDYETLADDVYDVVQPIMACPTIISKQGKPRPNARPYAVIEVGAVEQMGGGEFDMPNSLGVNNVWSHNQINVQFTAFGPSSKSVIQKLHFALENKDSVADAFLDKGMAIVTQSNILDIPAIRDTIWEESSRFDATFNVRVEDTDTVGVIEEVIVTGELTGADVETPVDTSFTITIAP